MEENPKDMIEDQPKPSQSKTVQIRPKPSVGEVGSSQSFAVSSRDSNDKRPGYSTPPDRMIPSSPGRRLPKLVHANDPPSYATLMADEVSKILFIKNYFEIETEEIFEKL